MNIKKILIICALCIGAYQLVSKQQEPLPTTNWIPKSLDTEMPKPAQNFTCDGREYCSQMHSYEEAKFFLDNCPNTKMDGDNDGIPCERQF